MTLLHSVLHGYPEAADGRVSISNVSVSVFLSWSLSLQVFRTDLITAMKLHDSFQLNPEEYYVLADPWRQEWEKGVQVPVSPGTIPEPVARYSLEEWEQIHTCLCWQLMSTLPWLPELYCTVPS